MAHRNTVNIQKQSCLANPSSLSTLKHIPTLLSFSMVVHFLLTNLSQIYPPCSVLLCTQDLSSHLFSFHFLLALPCSPSLCIAPLIASSAQANDTMRSWPSMRQHSSSIPIPMTLTDESVQNLGMSTTPQDLAAILNSPLAHSIDHEAHLLSESMDFSPSNYLFLNSPSRPQPHL